MTKPLDHLGMWDAVASLAEQLELAMENSLPERPLPLARDIDNIVPLGWVAQELQVISCRP